MTDHMAGAYAENIFGGGLTYAPDPGFGFGGAKSSAEGARIEALKAPRVYGAGYREGVSPFPLAVPPPQNFFFIFWSQNAYFGAFSGHLECLFLQCHTSINTIARQS